MTDRPVPKPPTQSWVTDVQARFNAAPDRVWSADEPLPEHVQFCVVGRPKYGGARRNNVRALSADPAVPAPPTVAPLILLAWLRETDDPERLLEQFRERNTDVHFERRTSAHERCTPDDVTAERDTTISVRDHFRPRDAHRSKKDIL